MVISTPELNRQQVFIESFQTSRIARLVCGLLFATTCLALLWNVLSWNEDYVETKWATPKTRKILLWTTFFGVVDFSFGLGKTPFIKHNCEISDCEVTTNKSEVNTSDAVIFHIRNFNDLPLPSFRQPNQRWVFFLLESPEHTGLDLQNYANIFNWTMTYRKDSDIYMPYGSFDQIQHGEQRNFSLVNKIKMIFWLVSNCNPPSQREVYIKNLQKDIPVDIRGGCGQPCTETHPCASLEKDYKFAISFENSICLDYITEKFFRALKNGAVPIVYGGGVGHELISPPHSYIDAEKFSSPRELSDYLRILHRNYSLYSEYHEWRRSYKVNDKTLHKAFCDLCKKLHFDNDPKTYPNIKQWWTERGHCRPIPIYQWE